MVIKKIFDFITGRSSGRAKAFRRLARMEDLLRHMEAHQKTAEELGRLSLGSVEELRHQVNNQLPFLRESIERLENSSHGIIESLRLLAHDGAILQSPKYADPRSLLRHHGQVFSQNGQDGMIAEIFRRIGTTNKVFVEIAAGNGRENNTRLLLQCGWKGLWCEADPAEVAEIRRIPAAELAAVALDTGFVTKENVDALLRRHAIPRDFDFLSLDIDYNTPHVWEGMSEFRPRAICIEYNGAYPPGVDFTVPYDPQRMWDKTNYYGASLKALERIGREKGYLLVGCDYLGSDAFFIRDDCAGDLFLPPYTSEFHHEPPRYGLHRHRGHPPHPGKA